MTNGQRAKIFAPYAALKGFGDCILGAECTAEERVMLGEDAQEELDRQLQHLHRGDRITVTYYGAGRYAEVTGTVKRVDGEERLLCLGTRQIPLEDVLALRCAE